MKTVQQPKRINCCKIFEKAQTWGTDHEGYAALMTFQNNQYIMDSIEEKINFCPWCGKKVEDFSAYDDNTKTKTITT